MTEDQRTTGNPRHPVPPSAATAASQVLSRLADLARTSLQTQARLAKQSVDLTWATLAEDLDRASANKAYVESVTRESARYWRTVGELGIDSATDLVILGTSVSTTVLREVAAARHKPGSRQQSKGTQSAATMMADGGGRAVTSAWRGGAPAAPVPDLDAGRHVAVTLRGRLGQRAEGTITVANQHHRPRRIQLGAGDLVSSTGAAVDAVLDLSPATVTVPSGKERSVSLGVDLDDGTFLAGERYVCTIDVSGGDEATIEVAVEVIF